MNFIIEQRIGSAWIKEWGNGGCCSATEEEVEMWQEITRLRSENEELKKLAGGDAVTCRLCNSQHIERAEKAEAALSSAKREGKEERKAFICKNCEGVYADEPVSACDCAVGWKPGYYEGVILYRKAAEGNE